MRYFPIAINLKDRFVVVVGAGKVAERKVKSLLCAGARVYVISPRANTYIKGLAKKNKIKWVPRVVQRSDLVNARLIIAATNKKTVNEYVSKWAQQFNVPVNVVDESNLSDFISPAIVRFKKALVTIYTDGKDPVFSRDLKNYLGEKEHDFVSYRNRL